MPKGHRCPIPIPKNVLKDVITNLWGNINAIAEHFGVTRYVIYNRLDKFNLHDHVQKSRFELPEHMCDIAETVLIISMTQKDNPRLAFDAAIKVLETHGRRRGWGKDLGSPTISPEFIKPVEDLFKAVAEAQSQAASGSP